MKIYYPQGFECERRYIIDTIFHEFLGLSYETEAHKDGQQNYEIVLNNKSIIIQDSFFSFQKDNKYLKKESIPTIVRFTSNAFQVKKDIPILYGTDYFEVSENYIECGIDVFSSSFFMLTRWEEYVNNKRDVHNRFPGSESVAFKNGFLDRPIVNEYVEMLWNMLKYFGIKQCRQKREFRFIPTHDIDHLQYWKSVHSLIRSMTGDVIKRKNIKRAFKKLPSFINTKLGWMNDPYDTFNEMMSLSEKANVQSRFYFMSGGDSKFDENYNIYTGRFKAIVKEIKSRGHVLGFHPSYNTYNSFQAWKDEKENLENALDCSINEGRQHYLRMEIPNTLLFWDQNNMKVDSTLGYADYAGFRCGVCYEFPVFDFLNKRVLKIKERPLIVMEGTLVNYHEMKPKDMYDYTSRLIRTTKAYHGDFVYLWHNSSFHINDWTQYQEVYYQVLNNFKDM